MRTPAPSLHLTLPDWITEFLKKSRGVLIDLKSRMDWIIELSLKNVEKKTGGPFAAAVFEARSGRLVAVGVNRVEPLNCSPAHAEIMAIMLAQKKLNTFDLGGKSIASHELISSSQPCLMCLGALLWSGVRKLAYGASKQDVEAILEFDEGPLPPNWASELQKRGIEIIPELQRSQACEVLTFYRDSGGTIYNSRYGG